MTTVRHAPPAVPRPAFDVERVRRDFPLLQTTVAALSEFD